MNDPEVSKKRFVDNMRDAAAGYSTTPEEDARLRQETPEEDWCVQQAKRIARDMDRNDPEFIEGMAEKFRESFDENGRLHGGRRARKAAPRQEDEEKPWNQDEFFNNLEEMKKYTRQKL